MQRATFLKSHVRHSVNIFSCSTAVYFTGCALGYLNPDGSFKRGFAAGPRLGADPRNLSIITVFDELEDTEIITCRLSSQKERVVGEVDQIHLAEDVAYNLGQEVHISARKTRTDVTRHVRNRNCPKERY